MIIKFLVKKGKAIVPFRWEEHFPAAKKALVRYRQKYFDGNSLRHTILLFSGKRDITAVIRAHI